MSVTCFSRRYHSSVARQSRAKRKITLFREIDTPVKKAHYRSVRHFADPFGAIQRGGYISRSGLKTAEMMRRFFVENIESAVSIGGPGGEVQYLTENYSCRVVGVTLLRPNAPDFDASLNRVTFTPNYGCDATGDITNLRNVISISRDVHRSFPGGVDFFGGDACSDKDMPVGDARSAWIATNENVVRHEVLLACCTLRRGGNAYFKVFSLVSDTMCMLLNLLSRTFDEVCVTKLNMSRSFSTELHIICRGFNAERAVFFALVHGIEVTNDMRARALAVQFRFDETLTQSLAVLKRVYLAPPHVTRVTANVTPEVQAFYVQELCRAVVDVPVGVTLPAFVARIVGMIPSGDLNAQLVDFQHSAYPDVSFEVIDAPVGFEDESEDESSPSVTEEVLVVQEPAIVETQSGNCPALVPRFRSNADKLLRVAFHPEDTHPAPVADRRPWYSRILSSPPVFTEFHSLRPTGITARIAATPSETPPVSREEQAGSTAPVESELEIRDAVPVTTDDTELHNPQLAIREYLGGLHAALAAETSNHNRVMDHISSVIDPAAYLHKERGGYIYVRYSDGEFIDVHRGFTRDGQGYRKVWCRGGFRLLSGHSKWGGFMNGDYGLLSTYCVIALEEELIDVVSGMEYDVSPQITFVQAGPGCGKTTDIISQVVPPNVDGASNVLICTKEGRADFEKKLCRKHPGLRANACSNRIRTVTSFLTNRLRNLPADTLYIDEALMSHPGMIFAAIQVSGANSVVMYGDTCQIPVVNYTPSYRMVHTKLTDFVKISRVLTVTYRCPADVACRLDSMYLANNSKYGFNSGLRGVRGKTNSCEVVRLSNENVPSVRDAQYLTFTQADKSVLLKKGFKDVSTVHEFQGKEAENVVVVRLDANSQSELFLRTAYAVVAISRHKRSLVYYTRVTTDALATMIANVPSDDEIRNSLAPVGAKMNLFAAYATPSEYKTLTIERVDIAHKYNVEKLYVVPRHGFYPDAGPKSGKPQTVVGDVWVREGKYRTYFVVGSDNSGDRISFRVLRNSFAALRGILAGTHQNTIYMSSLASEHLGITELSATLYRDIPRKVVVCSTVFVEEVAPEVFSLLNVNGINTIDNKEFVSVELFEPDFCVPVADSAPPFVIQNAQNFLQACFGPITYDDQSLDAFMVRTFDLSVDLGSLSYSQITAGFHERYFDSLTPTIISPVPFRRTFEYREQLLGLAKRNRNVPYTTGIVDINATAVEMVDGALRSCFTHASLKKFNSDPIRISAGSIHEWLKKQAPGVVNLIESEHCLNDTALDNYSFSIKPTPKPNLTIDATSSYAALQTIVYHEKPINAMFCQVFREVKKRVIACLKPHIKIFADVSIAEFEDMLNRDIPCSSIDGYDKLEVDIGKYDKSQMEIALECDCEFLRRFGVDTEIIKLWRYSHMITHVRNRQSRLATTIAYQRKSGDASTFLGNTLFLLAVLADRIPLDEMVMVLVSGDDSLIIGSDLAQYQDTTHFGLKFNLDVKFFTFDYSYFCSKFLLPVNGRWTFTPDPLKLITKLGRHDMVNRAHVEEYRISFVDNCVNYRNTNVCFVLGAAVAERYRIYRDFSSFFSTIPSLFEPASFQTLFVEPPGGRLDDRKFFNGYDF